MKILIILSLLSFTAHSEEIRPVGYSSEEPYKEMLTEKHVKEAKVHLFKNANTMCSPLSAYRRSKIKYEIEQLNCSSCNNYYVYEARAKFICKFDGSDW